MIALFTQQVFSLLTTPPGNLAYHLVLAFSVAAALQASINLWRHSASPAARRMIVGLSLLFVLRVGLIASSGLAWQAFLVPASFVPVLDRATTALSLALIVWLWTFPDPTRTADAATLLITLLVVTTAALTQVWWDAQPAGLAFNGTTLDWAWEGLSLFLLAVGVLLALTRRPVGWKLSLLMLVLLAAGHVAHLLAPMPESDLPASVRLFQVIAYPFLLYLPQRFRVVERVVEFEAAADGAAVPEASAPALQRLDLQTFQVLLDLLIGSHQEDTCQIVTQIVSQAFLADLCVMISAPVPNGDPAIVCGYDLIRENHLHGAHLEASTIPNLVKALRAGKTLRLSNGEVSEDSIGLGKAIGLAHVGPVLAAPIQLPTEDYRLGLVLLSPYAHRTWTEADEAHLLGINRSLSQLLERGPQQELPGEELEQLRYSVKQAQASVQQAGAEKQALEAELKNLREQLTQAQVRAESLAALVAAREISRGENPTPADAGAAEKPAELGALEQPQSKTEELEAELRMSLQEIARLRGELSAARERANQHEAEPDRGQEAPGERYEVITSLSQELRQPMSSIIGYTELLLGESTGILGALQRKFLERIKVSAQRVGVLLDDLINVTSLDEEQFTLEPESVNLAGVIDEAVSRTSDQLQEKSITLNLDLPEALPQLKADPDALQQVVIHLLQNASSATPAEGEVGLRARLQEDPGQQDFVLLQVIDRGGGIPTEDLPRVFSRLYRADNPLIPGVGDTGVGLSIVKTLVEAHEGRVWVDTESGVGSTFSVVLPVTHSSSNGSMKAAQA